MSNPSSNAVALALVLAVCAVAADQPVTKKVVTPKGIPAGKNFSPGLMVGDTLYVSGQTGSDPVTQKQPEKFEDEVSQCLKNVGAILEAGGMNFSDVVSVQVYLTDMALFQRMNGVYISVFPEPRPTRTTVGVAKLAGPTQHIEITVTARK